MNGDTFPFVAGCLFFGLGALLILSLLRYLGQLCWRGRATGSIVAIDTVSAAEGTQAIAKAVDVSAADPASQRNYRPFVSYTVAVSSIKSGDRIRCGARPRARPWSATWQAPKSGPAPSRTISDRR